MNNHMSAEFAQRVINEKQVVLLHDKSEPEGSFDMFIAVTPTRIRCSRTTASLNRLGRINYSEIYSEYVNYKSGEWNPEGPWSE